MACMKSRVQLSKCGQRSKSPRSRTLCLTIGVIVSCMGLAWLFFLRRSGEILSSQEIQNMTDGYHSLVNAPNLRAAHTLAPSRHLLALLIPARSIEGTESPADLALFQHLIPSMIGTLKCDHMQGVSFALYVGYDAGDHFYDDSSNREWIHEKYLELWNTALTFYPSLSDMSSPPPLRLFRYVAMKGAPCWIWNMLSKQAYKDGATHFLQLNDDNRMLSNCWASNMLSVLDMEDGFGVVGPRDMNNNRILTQSMVSRTHIDIFGQIYPDVFRNWYSDDWLTMVYGERHTTMDDRVTVINSQTQGTRYHKNEEASEWLEDEVDKGMRLISMFLDFESIGHRETRTQSKRKVGMLSYSMNDYVN